MQARLEDPRVGAGARRVLANDYRNNFARLAEIAANAGHDEAAFALAQLASFSELAASSLALAALRGIHEVVVVGAGPLMTVPFAMLLTAPPVACSMARHHSAGTRLPRRTISLTAWGVTPVILATATWLPSWAIAVFSAPIPFVMKRR